MAAADGGTITVTDPFDGAVVGTVPSLDRQAVRAAIDFERNQWRLA